jgi:hypothetical protein
VSVLVRFGIARLPIFPNAGIGKWRMSRKDFDRARAALDTFLVVISSAGPEAAKWAGRVVFEVAE